MSYFPFCFGDSSSKFGMYFFTYKIFWYRLATFQVFISYQCLPYYIVQRKEGREEESNNVKMVYSVKQDSLHFYFSIPQSSSSKANIISNVLFSYSIPQVCFSFFLFYINRGTLYTLFFLYTLLYFSALFFHWTL